MSDYIMFSIIYPKKEHYQETKEALLRTAQKTRDSEGVVHYDMLEGAPLDGKIYFYERYRSKEDFLRRKNQPFMQEVIKNYPEWLEGHETLYELCDPLQ